MLRRLSFAALLVALGGCGGGDPYVLTDYRNHQRGIVEVCYDDGRTPFAQAQSLADGICKNYDRMASFQIQQKMQCNWTTPTLALFYCEARPGEHPAPFVRQRAPLRRDILPGQNE